ncbi:MAG: pyruvate dehydrogenase (acetyl-transferring) E1 component subunit alpha [Bacteroidales bacterium]|nr:pyruvate dehydrogenase (acetyl-transferring) E1 component subunit alpha [Bacteroidales bacterium]
MFKEFPSIDDKMLQVIDNNGKIINEKYFPKLEDEKIVKAYKDMLFERTADLMTVSYQRQGRIFTYPPNYGQEGIHIAAGMVIRDNDWVVPAFRELGVYLSKGATLKEIFLYFMGYEDGTVFKDAKNIMPISVPIASQFTHAAGLGYSIKYRKQDDVVFAFIGDGGTSEGDFHEALNFAAVWKVPVVFVVQNNQYAISTSKEDQTISKNYAIKSLAYGMEGIKVDGNDIFAMYSAFDYAREYANSSKGPVLIEALTYRKGAHTTSDDPTKYRTKEEEQEWEDKDPLKRLRSYLISKDLIEEENEEKLITEYKKEIDRIFEEAENYGSYDLDDVFKHLYAEMPDDLKQQKLEHEKFLKWKEEKFPVK